MRLNLTHRSVTTIHVLDALIERRILALGERLRIDEANVVLEYDPAASPGYRVSIHLVIPGPDLRVTGCNHTLSTAFDKAMAALEEKLVEREHRLRRRHRTPVSRARFPSLRFAAAAGR